MFFNFCCITRTNPVTRFSSLRIFRRNISRSYYDVLKVSPTCTSKEIRDAFLVLSKQNHPDKHMNDPSMHEKFVQINEAYSTLINPSKRRAYDITLEHKRKLNAPYEHPYAERKSSTYSETFHAQRRNPSEGSDFYKDPFSWQFHDKSQSKSQSQNERAKRYSNSTIVSLLITFTVVGVILQILAIRSSFLTNHEKMVERSREYGLIHSIAREKARLYGNAHQIEILKSNLDKSFVSGNEQKPSQEGVSSGNQSDPPVLNKGKNEGTKKCALHGGNHDRKSVASAKHQRQSDDSLSNDSRVDLAGGSSKICQKCKHQKSVNK